METSVSPSQRCSTRRHGHRPLRREPPRRCLQPGDILDEAIPSEDPTVGQPQSGEQLRVDVGGINTDRRTNSTAAESVHRLPGPSPWMSADRSPEIEVRE